MLLFGEKTHLVWHLNDFFFFLPPFPLMLDVSVDMQHQRKV